VSAATPHPLPGALPNGHTEASLLGRLFERSGPRLSLETANYFLGLRFTDEESARMNELSHKAQSGTLTPPESAELDAFIHVADFLALMQSRARRSLKASLSAGR
jgi:hypothetical protein